MLKTSLRAGQPAHAHEAMWPPNGAGFRHFVLSRKRRLFSLRRSLRQAKRISINIFFFLFLSIGIGVVRGLNALVVSRSFLGCFPSRRMSPSPMACPVYGCTPYSKMIISHLFSKVNLFSAVCTTIAGANHLQICNRPVRHSRRLHERRRGRQLGDPLRLCRWRAASSRPYPVRWKPRAGRNPIQRNAPPDITQTRVST